jgi:transcriptional regulator with XRE-family HTH domain
MLSATLEAGLSDYAIGGRIRALRLKKKMGLVELGQHSGLSPALLSKLERGRLFPTLLRIALIFSAQGQLNVHIDGQEHALESGDSMYFDSGLPHGYRRRGTSTCCAIVVTTA